MAGGKWGQRARLTSARVEGAWQVRGEFALWVEQSVRGPWEMTGREERERREADSRAGGVWRERKRRLAGRGFLL